MASEELYLAARPEGDDNVNNQSSADITYVENALKALSVQSDSGKVSSDILQHSNGSKCGQITVDNTETHIISSELEETNLSKDSQESICEGKEISAKTEENDVTGEKIDKYVIAGDKEDSNECQGLYASSKFEETRNQNSNCMPLAKTEKELLKEELKFLQCPFTWNLNFKNARTTTEGIIAKCNDKLDGLENGDEDDDDDEEGEFKWRRFILTLILCHEHYVNGSSSEALAKLQECENLIDKCQSSEKPDIFFKKVKDALLHVVIASKCHLLVSVNILNDAVKLKNSISRYEDMDRQNMAALFGIQSSMLMEYGYEGTKTSLEYAKKAVNLDGDEAEWHFIYGKALGRIRRVENFTDVPSQEELSALEQSMRTSKTAARTVFLAQAYREAASKAFGKNRNNIDSLKDILTKMNEKSLQLYWEALKMKDNSVRVNIRCAAGLLKLPRPFQDLKKAKEIIEKALEVAPNNAMANHIAGNLYERLSKFELAEKFYKKSGELGAYGACMNLLTMKIKRDRKYDPLAELDEMLQQFTEITRLQETYLQMGSYLYHYKNDTFTALDYWMKGIEIDQNAAKLKTHKCSFLDLKTPVNLYQVIVDEIRLALEQNNHTDENILKLRKMLLYCGERYPELLTNKPQSWKQQSLKEQSIQGRRKNQDYGRGAGQRHRNKHSEHWRSETREEDRSVHGRSFRDNSNRSHDFRNKDHSQFKQHENWRHNPRNTSDEHRNAPFSDEVCYSAKKSSYRMSSVDNASNSTEKDKVENLGSKRNRSQQPSGINEAFQRNANAQEKYQRYHRGSWRNKDSHSSPEQHVHQNESQHSRRRNDENRFRKHESSERN